MNAPAAGELRYFDAVSTVLNASGTVSIVLARIPPSVYVDIDEVRVDVGGPANPNVILIHGRGNGRLVLDSTRTGSSNKSSPPGFRLWPGEQISVVIGNGSDDPTVFATGPGNGTPGAAVYVQVRGTQRRLS